MEPFDHDGEKEKYYADILRMNSIDVIEDAAVEAEMSAALKEYDQIGVDLGITSLTCKGFTEDPNWSSRWMIGEDYLQKV